MRVRLVCEFAGAFFLVFAGCGSAVLAASYTSGAGDDLGVGFVGVALAFGLSVTAMAYAAGHLSGGHFNPAVTVGLALARRIEWQSVGPYVAAQVAGASMAGAALFLVASGRGGFDAATSGFASNGYGSRSPDGYSMLACLVIEVVLTLTFVWVILGVTDERAPTGFGPLAIGLTLTVIHLVSIPVTNTSVNPARSLGVAWFAGPAALGQVWLFIVAPLVGAAVAGLSYHWLTGISAQLQPRDKTAWSTVRRTPGTPS